MRVENSGESNLPDFKEKLKKRDQKEKIIVMAQLRKRENDRKRIERRKQNLKK